MRSPSKRRRFLPPAVLPLLVALLFVPQAGAATQVPTLASTPQYKALVQYVAKLQGISGRPTSAAQKSIYETELTGKHGAAVLKSTALFLRGKKAASKETQSRFQAGSKKIRKAETGEIALLQDQYADRLDNAADAYADDLGALADTYGNRIASLQKEIADLRVRKAKSKDPVRKDQIQSKIAALIGQVADARRQQGKARIELKTRYAEEKASLRTGKQRAIGAVREEADESVDKLRNRWNRTYNRKVANLQVKRTSQVADLEAKLTNGRLAIASMPTVG